MPKRRIITTARGTRLDMDALKASQPNVRPLVISKDKDKPATKPVQIAATKRTPRVRATVPAPIPKPHDLMPVQPINPAIPTEKIELATKVVKHAAPIEYPNPQDTMIEEPVEPTVISGKKGK